MKRYYLAFLLICLALFGLGCSGGGNSSSTEGGSSGADTNDSGSGVSAPTNSVVKKYGQLKVVNGQLCDNNGNAIQLKGMSSHGLSWYPFGNDTVKNLVNDWHISVVRAAMYPTEYNGYITNPAVKDQVKKIVADAVKYGIYVIIDWHCLNDGSNNPQNHQTQAIAFFEEMAQAYKNYPNVIYEICNEPNGGVTWKDNIKPYAEKVIPAIRKYDAKNIIIVGTDTYSQGVKAAADDPLNYSNIMYALHFYAGTHKQWLRDNAEYALNKKIALFVSEWGTTDASGQGAVDKTESQVWVDWMNSHKISWVNWSISTKGEPCSALTTSANLNGPWSSSDLTESGAWVKSKM